MHVRGPTGAAKNSRESTYDEERGTKRRRERVKWTKMERQREKRRERKESEISFCKNREYKKEKIFYMDVLKTIHKKISNQKMKSKERDKSILEYVQCMYNNVHTYKVPGF